MKKEDRSWWTTPGCGYNELAQGCGFNEMLNERVVYAQRKYLIGGCPKININSLEDDLW